MTLTTTTYRAGVVVDLEVRFILVVLAGFGLAERRRLAKMVLVQLGKEGLVRSLREHALLLKDGQDTHRLNTATIIIIHFRKENNVN